MNTIISVIKYSDEQSIHKSWLCPKECPLSIYRHEEFGFQVCQLNCCNVRLEYNKVLKRYERSQLCKESEALLVFLENNHRMAQKQYKLQKIKITTPHKLGDIIDKRILGFKEAYSFLSNFYPCSVEYERILYPSVQHAYQAAKTFNLDLRNKIKGLKHAHKAKKMGNSLQLRVDWQYVKYDIMKSLVYYKFANDFELLGKLLQTSGMQLIECNTWNDRDWGMTYDSNKQQYIGINALGIILMDVRNKIYNMG